MKNTLVLGLGNILLSDEGLGVRVIERLEQCYHFSDDVRVLDGGTLGLDLLPYLEDAHRLLVVDVLEMGAAPGTIARLEGDEIPAFLGPKVSPHQMGLADLLVAARLRDLLPQELVLWGAQPQTMKVGLELSPCIAAQVDPLVGRVLDELSCWGIRPATSTV
jgi:hydrogenase maturation protease